MLTVKHIAPTGHEHIWPAIRVSYQPAGAVDAMPRYPATIFIDRMGDRGLVDTIDVGANGMWYVMNEQGKTIARYELTNSGVASAPTGFASGPNLTLSISGNNTVTKYD